jgi:hypothetical protein
MLKDEGDGEIFISLLELLLEFFDIKVERDVFDIMLGEKSLPKIKQVLLMDVEAWKREREMAQPMEVGTEKVVEVIDLVKRWKARRMMSGEVKKKCKYYNKERLPSLGRRMISGEVKKKLYTKKNTIIRN